MNIMTNPLTEIDKDTEETTTEEAIEASMTIAIGEAIEETMITILQEEISNLIEAEGMITLLKEGA